MHRPDCLRSQSDMLEDAITYITCKTQNVVMFDNPNCQYLISLQVKYINPRYFIAKH